MTEHIPELALLAGVWALAVMLPGPNFLLVGKASVAGRGRQGLGAALGISIGAVIWATSSLLGLALLFSKFQWLYEIFKIVGGGYLIWIGFKSFRAGFWPAQPVKDSGYTCNGRPHVLLGLMTSLSNPKTAAFFAGIFATLLSPEAPFWVPATAVCLVFAISLAWYSWLAVAFSSPWARRGYNAAKRPLDVVLGGLFMFLGGKLATSE